MVDKTNFFILILFCLFSVFGLFDTTVAMIGIETKEVEFMPGEALIRLQHDNTVDELVQRITNAKPQLSQRGIFLSDNFLLFRETLQFSNFNVWRLKFKGAGLENNLLEFIEWLNTLDIIVYVEPNRIGSIAVNDLDYFRQWNFGPCGINVETVWQQSNTGSNVIVAVLDTGVGYADGDGRKKATDFSPDTFMVPAGSDIVNNDDFPLDDHGHGTHVAGTIAQATDNDIGVSGIAYNCTIIPVKVAQADGSVTAHALAKGINYATMHKANVINISLTFDYKSNIIEDAVQKAYNESITIVASAGNKGKTRKGIAYPASSPYCIAVGAINEFGVRASFSQYGSGLDFVAPGHNIIQETYLDWEEDENGKWVLTPGHSTPTFTELSGTSMAASHVSGLAALLIAQGIKNPDDVKKALQESAYDLGDAEEYGYGLVNGAETITICSQPKSQQYLLMLYQASSVEDIKRDGLSASPHLAYFSPKSALLQNYPNPFNPETWIPYQIAEDAEVTITIYAASGKLIRAIYLGGQAAGIYLDREKAAYWDGKNNVGESVSSGAYFYTIRAGKFTATRRMILLK